MKSKLYIEGCGTRYVITGERHELETKDNPSGRVLEVKPWGWYPLFALEIHGWRLVSGEAADVAETMGRC